MAIGGGGVYRVNFDIRADGTTAVRTVRKVADESDRTGKRIKQNNEEAASSFSRLGEHVERTRHSIGSLTGMIGLGGLAFGLKDAVQGGMALQANQAQLQQALRATGQASTTSLRDLTDYAEKLSTHGGFDTSQNIQSLAAFTRETHSATQAQAMLSLSTDIARGRNMDLASAQSVVARAYTGQVGRLQQLLGPMVAVKNAQYGLSQAHKEQVLQLEAESKAYGKLGPQWLKQKEFADGITPQMHALATLQDRSATARQIIAAAQTVFGGSTSAFAHTTTGKLQDFQHSLKNLTDTVGMRLIPTIGRFATDLTGIVTVFTKLPGPVQDSVLGLTALGIIAGPLHKSFQLMGDAVNGAKWAIGLFTGATEAATAAERINAGANVAGGAETAVAGAAGAAGAGEVAAGAAGGLGAAGVGLAGVAALGAMGAGYGLGRLLGGAHNGVARYQNTKGLSPRLGSLGIGPVHRAFGGLVPGSFASGDNIPVDASAGEYVLRRQAVQAIGVSALNAINQTGRLAGNESAQPIILNATITLPGGRVLAEEVMHFAQKRTALA